MGLQNFNCYHHLSLHEDSIEKLPHTLDSVQVRKNEIAHSSLDKKLSHIESKKNLKVVISSLLVMVY